MLHLPSFPSAWRWEIDVGGFSIYLRVVLGTLPPLSFPCANFSFVKMHEANRRKKKAFMSLYNLCHWRCPRNSLQSLLGEDLTAHSTARHVSRRQADCNKKDHHSKNGMTSQCFDVWNNVFLWCHIHRAWLPVFYKWRPNLSRQLRHWVTREPSHAFDWEQSWNQSPAVPLRGLLEWPCVCARRQHLNSTSADLFVLYPTSVLLPLKW